MTLTAATYYTSIALAFFVFQLIAILYYRKKRLATPPLFYADISEIDNADWSKYSTCRGRKTEAEHIKMLDLIGEPNAEDCDENQDAINDGLWDWYSHQYTLYSATPLALNYLLREIKKGRLKNNRDIATFVANLKFGSRGIHLEGEENQMNQRGELPLFRIKDILEKYKDLVEEIVKLRRVR